MESLLTAVQEEQCDRATALKCAAGPLSGGRPAARPALVREIKINRTVKQVQNRTVQKLRSTFSHIINIVLGYLGWV